MLGFVGVNRSVREVRNDIASKNQIRLPQSRALWTALVGETSCGSVLQTYSRRRKP